MSVEGYPPYEQRNQMEVRAQRMHFQRPDWLGTVEDADISYRSLGAPVPFSGDHRPTDRSDR